MKPAGTVYCSGGLATALGIAVNWQKHAWHIVAAEIAGHATAVKAIASAFRAGEPIGADRQLFMVFSNYPHSVIRPPEGPRTVVFRRLPGGLLHATLLDERCRVTPQHLHMLRSETTYLVQRAGTGLDPARVARRLRVLHRIPLLDEWAEQVTTAAVRAALIEHVPSGGSITAWRVSEEWNRWRALILGLLEDGTIQATDSLWRGGAA